MTNAALQLKEHVQEAQVALPAPIVNIVNIAIQEVRAASVQQSHNQNLSPLRKRIHNARQLQKKDQGAAAQQAPAVAIAGNMENNGLK